MVRSRMFWKPLLVYLTLTALAVGGLAAIAAQELSTIVWNSASDRLVEINRATAGAAGGALRQGDELQIRSYLRSAFSTVADRGFEIAVLDASGQVLGDWPTGQPQDNQRHRPEIQQALRGARAGNDRRISTISGLPTLYSALAVRDGDQLLGFVRSGISEIPLRARAWQSTLKVVGVAILGWLTSAAIAWFAITRQLLPLSQLTADAKALAAGDDREVVLLNRSDEIGELATAIGDIRAKRLHGAIELRANSELLVSVLENMLEGVVALAANETVLLANGASGRMLGFAAATAVGRALPEITRSRPLLECVREALKTGRVSRDEFEALGESRRILAVRAAPLAGNRGSGAVVVLHDVTDLRRLENLRKEFVANVSHELKTPLASVKAYAETLRLGAINDAEHRMMFIERIEEQAERLHQLIVDLLHLARIEAGQEAFEFSDVSLRDSVHICVEQFAAAASAKNIQLRVADDLPPLVLHVDDEGLRTILSNLIDNALKYTPAGGRVDVAWRAESGYAVISVTDTGIGIARRNQTRIFERFFRVDKARSRELGGTGLGLSIVKHLCQAFGGDVNVESQEGVGSTFRVRLPLASISAARADSPLR